MGVQDIFKRIDRIKVKAENRFHFHNNKGQNTLAGACCTVLVVIVFLSIAILNALEVYKFTIEFILMLTVILNNMNIMN